MVVSELIRDTALLQQSFYLYILLVPPIVLKMRQLSLDLSDPANKSKNVDPQPKVKPRTQEEIEEDAQDLAEQYTVYANMRKLPKTKIH